MGNLEGMTETPNHELAHRMAEMARIVALPRSVEDVLADVTAEAKRLIPGVDKAGVLLIGKGGQVRDRWRSHRSCRSSTSCR